MLKSLSTFSISTGFEVLPCHQVTRLVTLVCSLCYHNPTAALPKELWHDFSLLLCLKIPTHIGSLPQSSGPFNHFWGFKMYFLLTDNVTCPSHLASCCNLPSKMALSLRKMLSCSLHITRISHPLFIIGAYSATTQN